MKDLKLSVKNSMITLLSTFISCNLGAAIMLLIIQIIIKRFSSFDIISYTTNTAVGYLIYSIIFYGIMLSLFFVFTKDKDNKIISKPTLKKSLLYFVFAVIIFATLLPIINSSSVWLQKLGIKATTLSFELTKQNYFISLLSIVLIPAICEELIFRGIIINGLKSKGKAFSITLTAVLFALYHDSMHQTIYPVLFGLFLSLIMYNENNILYPIIAHATNNFLALTISYYGLDIFFNTWWFIALAIALLVVYLIIITIFISKKDNQKIEDFSLDDTLYLISAVVIMCVIWIVVNCGMIIYG